MPRSSLRSHILMLDPSLLPRPLHIATAKGTQKTTRPTDNIVMKSTSGALDASHWAAENDKPSPTRLPPWPLAALSPTELPPVLPAVEPSLEVSPPLVEPPSLPLVLPPSLVDPPSDAPPLESPLPAEHELCAAEHCVPAEILCPTCVR